MRTLVVPMAVTVAEGEAVGLDDADEVIAALGAAAAVVVGRNGAEDQAVVLLLARALDHRGVAGDHLHVVVVRVVVADDDHVSRLLERAVSDGAPEAAGLVGVRDDLGAVGGGDEKCRVSQELDLHAQPPVRDDRRAIPF
jgi:hypothetical protein